jgi:hypothetical protein
LKQGSYNQKTNIHIKGLPKKPKKNTNERRIKRMNFFLKERHIYCNLSQKNSKKRKNTCKKTYLVISTKAWWLNSTIHNHLQTKTKKMIFTLKSLKKTKGNNKMKNKKTSQKGKKHEKQKKKSFNVCC